ncbi:MAG: YbhB/YbcL family Raf kinase inhibitor-like protein [Citrobacter freundii]|nr:MAG: YbhB/YbcL family Raf kinase inhibitor-like protein [Citrobacter freundii]
MKHTAFSGDAEKAISYKELKISSSAFSDGGVIPLKYACDGDNISPPLSIAHVPEQALSLLIVMEDIDAPIRSWTHWLAWNIPVTHHINEGRLHGTQGLNDFGHLHYTGPCPASGTHRYAFRIYALDMVLDMPFHTHKFRLQKEISGHVIAFGELTGLYTKKEKHFADTMI